MLFVDQFEELYTLTSNANDRNAFASALVAVGDDPESPLCVVVSMRSNFLDRAGENQRFLEQLTQGLLFLQPPDRNGIREALTQPVEMLGYKFESSKMIGEMLESLEHTPGALPLMQFAASKLWDDRDQTHKLLTEASYRRMGGVEGTLAIHANETLASLGHNQRRIVKTIFQRLVTPERTRAIRDVAELRALHSNPSEIDKIIGYLVKARLLVVQIRDEAEGAAVEIVHESLISEWPSLRQWLDEGHEDAAFVEQLRGATKQWEQKKRPMGLLWRGDACVEARRFQKRFKGELARGEGEFLEAVLALDSTARRRRPYAVISGMVFLSGLVVASAIALVMIRSAQQEAETQAEAAMAGEKRAQGAELDARKQLAQKEAAEKAVDEAKARAAASKAKTEQGLFVIAETKEELKEALVAAENAAELAEAARGTAEAQRARARKLLTEREAEVRKLKAQGRKINKTLD